MTSAVEVPTSNTNDLGVVQKERVASVPNEMHDGTGEEHFRLREGLLSKNDAEAILDISHLKILEGCKVVKFLKG